MKSKLITVLALVTSIGASLVFTGCETTAVSPRANIAAKFAVQYAVLKVAEKQPDKARRIVAIAKEVQSLAGTDQANTVDLLVTLIKAKVEWSKLDAADTLLVHTLIDAIGAELKARVGTGPVLDDKLLIVRDVASWVIEQASLALPPA